jgi:hypothetical protein
MCKQRYDWFNSTYWLPYPRCTKFVSARLLARQSTTIHRVDNRFDSRPLTSSMGLTARCFAMNLKFCDSAMNCQCC